MACTQVCAGVLVFFSILQGVMGADTYNIGGLVAAAVASFVLLVVVVTMLIVGLTWKNWYPSFQRSRGKEKLPREYFIRKEEMRRQLLNGSRPGSIAPSEVGFPRGTTNKKVQDTDEGGKEKWLQGWNDSLPNGHKHYEEKNLTMELGEEVDDFRIETTIIDDETLDLGPYKDSSSHPTAVLSEPTASSAYEDVETKNIYSVVDRSRLSSAKSKSETENTTEKVTSFSKNDPTLVAF